MKAIVTGASGFVGSALARRVGASTSLALGADGWRGRIDAADLRDAVVFHLAARVHSPRSPAESFVVDNVQKTAALAQAAAKHGARRVVFLSTIKVNGEESGARAIAPGDRETPADEYARSKWAAEQALRDVASRTGLSVCVVRAPLVIGDGAKGNLSTLMRLADTSWPLPFAAIPNRRTFVHVDDLAALLVLCAEHRAAHDALFFAGHPDAVATPRLVRVLRKALGREARLFAVPPRMLEAFAAPAGLSHEMRRLTRSLEIDVSATRRELGWENAVAIDEGIARMARAFRSERRAR